MKIEHADSTSVYSISFVTQSVVSMLLLEVGMRCIILNVMSTGISFQVKELKPQCATM